MLAQDTLDGHMAERQIPLALQALGAEGGKLAPQGDDSFGQLPRDLVRTGMGSAGEFLKALQLLGLIAPQPLAHRGHGGVKVCVISAKVLTFSEVELNSLARRTPEDIESPQDAMISVG